MKLLLILLVTLTPAASRAGGTFSLQEPGASQSVNRSQELARADDLHAEVVKLFADRKYDQALALAKQVLEIREKILGPDHLMVGLSLQNIAELLIAKNKHKDAADIYRRLVAIYDQPGASSNTKLVGSLERYICLLVTIGRKDETKDLLKRLFKVENGFEESSGMTGQGSKVEKLLQGRAVILPKPEYTAEARDKRIAGSVVMKIKVSEEGKAVAVTTLCGDPILSKASEAAISGARFEPAVIQGKPVQFISTITYNFVIP